MSSRVQDSRSAGVKRGVEWKIQRCASPSGGSWQLRESQTRYELRKQDQTRGTKKKKWQTRLAGKKWDVSKKKTV